MKLFWLEKMGAKVFVLAKSSIPNFLRAWAIVQCLIILACTTVPAVFFDVNTTHIFVFYTLSLVLPCSFLLLHTTQYNIPACIRIQLKCASVLQSLIFNYLSLSWHARLYRSTKQGALQSLIILTSSSVPAVYVLLLFYIYLS